jgi:putative selenium metabolism hydrolase
MTARILERSRAMRDFTAKNLSQLVAIPSLSGEEGPVIERLGTMLDDAGFDTLTVDGLGNLIGVIGESGPIVAFDAHVDIVDTGEREQWELDPFCGAVERGHVYGRGSVDQKGGAAALVTAGRLLKEIGYDLPYRLYFTFTIMEEDCDGLCWNYLVEREKVVPEYAVITEPTNLGVYRGQRGRMEIEIDFTGVSAHGSAPERGDNALYRASEAVLRIRELNDRLANDAFLGRGTVAVTQILSSAPSLCAIPDFCTIHLDRRLTWGESRESALEEITEATDGKAEIRVPRYERASYRGRSLPQDKYYPTWKLEESNPLVRAGCSTFMRLTGSPPLVGKWTFSTNGVSLCGTHGIPTIGFGPGDEAMAHAPNERLPVDHLETASAFYALFPWILDEYGKGGKDG